VLIEGVTLVDSPFWVVHPTFCSNVIVRGVTVISPHINNDGVDTHGR
jgi:polygalacturonase